MKKYKITNTEKFTSVLKPAEFYNDVTAKFPWSKEFSNKNIKISMIEVNESGQNIGDEIYVNAGNTNPYLLLFFSAYLKTPSDLIGKIIWANIESVPGTKAHKFNSNAAAFFIEEPKTELVIKNPFMMKIYIGSQHESTQTLRIVKHNEIIKKNGTSFQKGDVVTILTKDLELISCICNRKTGDSFYIHPNWMAQLIDKYKVLKFGQAYAKHIECIAMFKGTKVFERDIEKIQIQVQQN